jgi:Transcription termination factor
MPEKNKTAPEKNKTASEKNKRRRRDGFTARTKQRNRALDVIFEADERDLLGQGDLLVLLNDRKVVSTAQSPIGDFGVSIVEAYAENADDIDTIVEAASEDWAMSRMNAVDRSILRAAAAELVYIGTDRVHVIPEWANLAREYSTEQSVGFIMGVLNKVADIRKRELSGGAESED